LEAAPSVNDNRDTPVTSQAKPATTAPTITESPTD